MAGGHDDQADSFRFSRPAEETTVTPNPLPPPRGGAGPVGSSAEPPSIFGQEPGQPDFGGRSASAALGGAEGSARPAAPRPTGGSQQAKILANQASEWEQNLQELDVVKPRRTGLILLGLLALAAVAVVAIVLAALSVFRGGGDDEVTGGDGVTADGAADQDVDGATDPATDGDGVDGSAGGDGADGDGADGGVDEPPAIDPNQLQVTLVEDPFVCDGGTREFAVIGGADPNEQVTFSSPQATGLQPGTADALGELPLRWQCDPAQAGTTWELTAAGATSGKSVTFIFAGVTAAGENPGTEPTTPPALTVALTENPFACDSTVRPFADLSGAAPNEEVTFSSPQSSGIRPGTADANGELTIRWQCDPAQAGTTWELTATGATSGSTVTFTFTGS